MERQNKRIPDMVNASMDTGFTQIPNDLIRNPKISSTAKTLLCIMLSNMNGWTTYVKVLNKMVKEGRDKVKSSIKELEEFGYLKRIKLRDKKKNTFAGMLWVYTNKANQFNLDDIHGKLQKIGLQSKLARQPGNPSAGNTSPNNNNSNNIKNEKIYKKLSGIVDYPFESPYFVSIWNQWKEYKLRVHKMEYATPQSEKSMLTRLYNMSGQDCDVAIQMLQQAIDKKWKGFYPLKETKRMNGHKKPQSAHENIKTVLTGVDFKDRHVKRVQTVYRQACLLDNATFGNKVLLSDNICDLFIYIHDNQPLSARDNFDVPVDEELISDYIRWLDDNSWITDITEKVFLKDSPLFEKYVREKNNKLQTKII